MKLETPHQVFLQYMGDGHEEYYIMCPGCKCKHRITVQWGNKSGKRSPTWKFNGSMHYPTFDPSLLVRSPNPDNPGKPLRVCHSFIREGKWEYLMDSTHEFRGQTVPIPDIIPEP